LAFLIPTQFLGSEPEQPFVTPSATTLAHPLAADEPEPPKIFSAVSAFPPHSSPFLNS
jgi:hypothetical protein